MTSWEKCDWAEAFPKFGTLEKQGGRKGAGKSAPFLKSGTLGGA